MPLHLQYRPKNLSELIGNESIKISLQSIFDREDKPHAFLFSGPPGSGKTTLGRIIANMLNCSPEDLHEYNSANTRGIDTIRDISEGVHYAALVGKVRVYICDEVHQWTSQAMNASLKLLEDTPKHVYFILCTTEPEKLLKTIRTRCTTFQTSLLTEAQMKKLIAWVLKEEKIKDYPESIIKEIIRVSEGCPRQALVILDSIIDIEDEKKALEAVSVVTIGEAEVINICRSLLAHERWGEMKGKVKEVLANTEPEKLRYAILGYMGTVLLNKDKDERLSELIDIFSEPTYSTGRAGIVNMLYLACQ